MSRTMLTLCLVWAIHSSLYAAGYVDRENFVIVVPANPTQAAAQQFAERMHERAEFFRRQIAVDWLGVELPDSVGRTVIHVDFSDAKDMGLTWAKDNPNRTFHNVYLKTSSDRALSTTLAHEMVHVVLATEYPSPNRLAAWIEEGIAGPQYDDQGRRQTRTKLLNWYVRSANWPNLNDLLNRRGISTNDKEAYAVAASLSEFLIERRGKQRLVRLGHDANELGWEPSLRENYNIQSISELQALWRAAVSRKYGEPSDRVAAVR